MINRINVSYTSPMACIDVVICEPENKYLHGHIVKGWLDDSGTFIPEADYDQLKYYGCKYVYDEGK